MWYRRAAVVLGVLCLGCGAGRKDAGNSPRGDPGVAGSSAEIPLYERLGGLDAIREVVDEFVARIAADPRINQFFVEADMGALKKHLVEQVCVVSGGPCAYSGRPMEEAHAGIGVGPSDFEALLENLGAALDELGVAEREKSELLGALGGMKDDIVGK
jgi:hemoglobin